VSPKPAGAQSSRASHCPRWKGPHRTIEVPALYDSRDEAPTAGLEPVEDAELAEWIGQRTRP